jgi:hypothetical protein
LLRLYSALAYQEGKVARAARLYGAAIAHTRPDEVKESVFQRLLSTAERDALAKECPPGKAMSLDEAVAFAEEDW